MTSTLRTLAVTGLLLVSCMVQADAVTEAMAAADRLPADLERDQREHPEVVVPLMNIGPGSRVADIFAGGGYYSELIGRVVAPEGVVLLHNNQAYLSFAAKALAQRSEGRDLAGVQRHDREVDDLDLGANTLDAAMIIMSYHDLYHTAEGWPLIDAADFMAQIVTALKPGGRFLIVDHVAAANTGDTAAQDLHRIDEAFAKQDIESYGLRLVASSDVLRNPDDDHTKTAFDPEIRGKTDRFVLVFEKPQ